MNTAATSAGNSHAVSEALGLWEPKRTLTLEAARRHTRRIRLIRRGLIGLAGLLLAGIIYQFATQRGSITLPDNPTESVKMVNPRYSGRTEDGLPFYLTADTATRTLNNRDEVKLIKPVLEFIRENGVESSFVEASEGTYDDVKKILNLRADVTLETDDGYRCETTHARIFNKEKRIEGDEPINCTGNFGNVSGNKYDIENNYKIFVFKDGMKAKIMREGEATATPTSETDPLFSFGGDGPINVTAQKATYVGNKTDLETDVEVVQDGAIINSNSMTILRDSTENENSGSIKLGAIKRITARDNFRYRTPENDVRGQQGVYESQKSLITVTGNVRVKQSGGNTVTTDRLTFNTRTETIRFSGNCQGRGCGSEGRTKAVIKGN